VGYQSDSPVLFAHNDIAYGKKCDKDNQHIPRKVEMVDGKQERIEDRRHPTPMLHSGKEKPAEVELLYHRCDKAREEYS
jgi:hypothetical protein